MLDKLTGTRVCDKFDSSQCVRSRGVLRVFEMAIMDRRGEDDCGLWAYLSKWNDAKFFDTGNDVKLL